MKGSAPIEVTANTEIAAANELRARIDATVCTVEPTKEYISALKNLVQSKRADSDWAMLKAHYHAPNRTCTATELAEAVGFPNHSTVNLRYGLLGQAIYDGGLINLPASARYPDGKPIFTFVIADGEKLEGDNWRWTMRPEVAEAIVALGLDK
jgi:putative restriction endonuclease